MKTYSQLLMLLIVLGGTTIMEAKNIYGFSAKRIDGTEQSLKDYQGKVLLVVNTASKCGLTKQYDGLQSLWEKYRDQGLVVLGFPANNFMNQEPGDEAEIESFCRLNFGVTFPLFAKISVRGKNIHPLYAWLTDKSSPQGGKISWNFNKFLISREGKVIDRFGSRVEPLDAELVQAVEQALK